MRDTIIRINDDARHQTYIHSDPVAQSLQKPRTLSIQRQHRLNRHIHVLKPILLKHDLHHPLPIRLGVHQGLGEEHLAPERIYLEFLVKCVVPEVLHIFPVSGDVVFHGLDDLEVVAVFGGFVADHDIFDDSGADTLFGAQDGAADDGGED